MAPVCACRIIKQTDPRQSRARDFDLARWWHGTDRHLRPQSKGDPNEEAAGSYYDAIETAVPASRSASTAQLAPLMDRVTAVRTVHHEVIDEHAAATNRMHTGRPISGTVTYPSIGSI